MFLRPNHRGKDGNDHTDWSPVETMRTPDPGINPPEHLQLIANVV
jgi:hypothetical protein